MGLSITVLLKLALPLKRKSVAYIVLLLNLQVEIPVFLLKGSVEFRGKVDLLCFCPF